MEKWASAAVSHMATHGPADKGKQDIDRYWWPNACQAAGAAISAFITADWPVNLITRDETDACKCLLKSCLRQRWHTWGKKWFVLKELITNVVLRTMCFLGNYY